VEQHSYGRALRNQDMHVLNEAMAPSPTWVSGHIYIGGIGLARGY
jgi:non-ribosomal peptide synthetase component F